jgi:hypothetical protein
LLASLCPTSGGHIGTAGALLAAKQFPHLTRKRARDASTVDTCRAVDNGATFAVRCLLKTT